MNILRLKTWSERQQVLAIIMLASGVTFLLWLFLLSPLFRRADRLEKEIETMRSELASKNYLLDDDVLQRKLEAEQKYNRRLIDEWAGMASELATFSNREDSVEGSTGSIDYKVALITVRQQLLSRAGELQIDMPKDLGMNDDVRSDEDSQKLMLQLRTAEKLVDMLLGLRIRGLHGIEPIPPLPHEGGSAKAAFLEEYPIGVRFSCTLKNLYELYDAILKPEHVFVIRQLRVETAADKRPDLLNVSAVISALVFLKNADTIAAKPVAGYPVYGPTGH